jgi:hypothetical protein
MFSLSLAHPTSQTDTVSREMKRKSSGSIVEVLVVMVTNLATARTPWRDLAKIS